jgi:hypothetical protein
MEAIADEDMIAFGDDESGDDDAEVDDES